MMLADHARGRDNNFNLIRMVAAFAVLVTHSFALVSGDGRTEPLREALGMTLGHIAVDVFFVTSGFLVTASLLTRQSIVEFVWARFLRIYPALWAMVGLTVFGVGVVMTHLPVGTYLSHSGTLSYLAHNATLFWGAVYPLPGVFEGNPYPNAVNGSLWTMPFEVRMYTILAGLWVVLLLFPAQRVRLLTVAIPLLALVGLSDVLSAHYWGQEEDRFSRLFWMFFSGSSFYLLRRWIVLSPRWGVVLGAAMLGSAFLNAELFFAVYELGLAYGVFCLAYLPQGAIRRYNRLGDYSYGTYIYAFPIQQTVIALVPGISVAGMIVMAGAVTLILAMTSWHVLERRALALKGRLPRWSMRLPEKTDAAL